METSRDRKNWLRLVGCLVLIGAIFFVYGGIVEHPFHAFDDSIYVTTNYHVQKGLTWEGVEWAFKSFDGANWHPLTWISHMVDISVFGPNPAGHYFVNIVLGCMVVVVIFAFLSELCGMTIGFWVAFLWAVHPGNVESIAWIAQRKSLLSLNLFFFGLFLFLRYFQSRRRYLILLSLVCEMLAAMAKPIAVLYPVAMLLVYLALIDNSEFGEQTFRKRCIWFTKVCVPFAVIAGYLSVVTFIAQDKSGATGFTYVTSFAWRAGNACEALLAYTEKCFFMSNTSVLYVLKGLEVVDVVLGILLILFVLLAVFASCQRHRLIAVGLGWYLLMFLPTIGLVQVGSQRIADRYLNLPLVGILIAVVYGVRWVSDYFGVRKLGYLLLGVWGVGLALQALAITGIWSDDLRLCLNAMAVGGDSTSMRINASLVEIQRRRFPQARLLLEGCQTPALGLQNLSIVAYEQGKYDEAIAIGQKLLSNKETAWAAAIALGRCYEAKGDLASAIRSYRGALRLLPVAPSFLQNVEIMRSALPFMISNLEKGIREKSMQGTESGSRQISIDTSLASGHDK